MELFDVVEVSTDDSKVKTVAATGKNRRNAEAIVNMAVIRRGAENSFFTTCQPGQYEPGDTFQQ